MFFCQFALGLCALALIKLNSCPTRAITHQKTRTQTLPGAGKQLGGRHSSSGSSLSAFRSSFPAQEIWPWRTQAGLSEHWMLGTALASPPWEPQAGLGSSLLKVQINRVDLRLTGRTSAAGSMAAVSSQESLGLPGITGAPSLRRSAVPLPSSGFQQGGGVPGHPVRAHD